MGGRFPALAVFGLPALTVAAALVVLWGLRPWEDNTVPHEAPLGIEMAVTGGKALPVPSTAGVAAGVAAPRGPRAVVQAAQRASGGNVPSSKPKPTPSPAALAVVPARAIAVAKVPSPTGTAPESSGGEEVPSGGATTGEAPPEGTSSPVAAPAGTGESPSKGPVNAGVKPPPGLESCAGDEYVIAVAFLSEESTVKEAPVSIVLKHLDADGTTDELQLEGDLGDVHALASTLEAEGNCVKVEIAQPEAEGGAEEIPGTGAAPESSEEAPAASEGTPESGEEAEAPAEPPVPISP